MRIKLIVLSLALCVSAFAERATKATVTISPSATSIASGAKQQFTATMSNGTSAEFYWSSTAGTISSRGLFTAPAVKVNTVVTIKAVRHCCNTQIGIATVTVVAPPPPPPPVQHTVDLTWDTDTSAVSYSVYRSLTEGSYALLASALTSTSYTDATVVSGETYYYVASATNAAGEESGYSNVAMGVIPTP